MPSCNDESSCTFDSIRNQQNRVIGSRRTQSASTRSFHEEVNGFVNGFVKAFVKESQANVLSGMRWHGIAVAGRAWSFPGVDCGFLGFGLVLVFGSCTAVRLCGHHQDTVSVPLRRTSRELGPTMTPNSPCCLVHCPTSRREPGRLPRRVHTPPCCCRRRLASFGANISSTVQSCRCGPGDVSPAIRQNWRKAMYAFPVRPLAIETCPCGHWL